MEERDQILIERYLAGDLTEAERHAIEARRDEDPLFRNEIAAYQMALEALRQKQRAELRQRFAKRDEILDKKKPVEPNSGKQRYTWLWAVAAAALSLVIWRFFFSSSQQTMPIQAETTDTVRIDPSPVVRIDTIDLKDSLRDQPEVENQKMPEPEMAASSEKGQELFAEYFEPYKDAMMDPTTRGDEELSQLQKYQKAYWDGEYPKAVELFPQLTPDEQGNDNYRFMYANTLLETGKTNQAISILESIIQNNRSRYVAEAHFGLAMCQLRKENIAQASDWLMRYVKLDKARKKEQANEIIHTLKE